METITDPDAWAAATFRHSDLGDARRDRRLVTVAAALARAPAAPLPDVFADWAALKAAYRLLRTPDVAAADILLGPTRVTAARAAGRATVLLLGDGTEADFTAHRAARGLGHIGNGGGRGLLIHSVLAVDAATREVLGPAAQRAWIRRGRKPGSRGGTRGRAHRRRESAVWLETTRAAADALAATPDPPARLIAVDDAGADIYDYVAGCVAADLGVVVRAAQDRATLPDESDGATRVRAAVAAAPVVVTTTVDVPARPGRAARAAAVAVHATVVTLRPPPTATHAVPLEVGLVWVTEVAPPAGVAPLEWLLVTTEPVETAADVLAVVAMYEARWLVEEFHLALKTGCAYETRQLATGHALRNLLALCTPLACELLRLRDAARAPTPRPATAVLTPTQVTVLRRLRPTLPATPTAQDALRWIASLGGFLMRAADGEPGWRTIWRGFRKLALAVEGYELHIRSG